MTTLATLVKKKYKFLKVKCDNFVGVTCGRPFIINVKVRYDVQMQERGVRYDV